MSCNNLNIDSVSYSRIELTGPESEIISDEITLQLNENFNYELDTEIYYYSIISFLIHHNIIVEALLPGEINIQRIAKEGAASAYVSIISKSCIQIYTYIWK